MLKTVGSDVAEAVAIVDGNGNLRGGGYRYRATVTRAANTTAYTANDVVGGVITFLEMGQPGAHIMFTSAELEAQIAAIPTGMTSFRLELYNTTPPSAYADNDAWDLGSSDRDYHIGTIELGGMVDKGSTLKSQVDAIAKQVRLASGSSTLYAYLVTNNSFTPAGNSEVYRVILRSIGL